MRYVGIKACALWGERCLRRRGRWWTESLSRVLGRWLVVQRIRLRLMGRRRRDWSGLRWKWPRGIRTCRRPVRIYERIIVTALYRRVLKTRSRWERLGLGMGYLRGRCRILIRVERLRRHQGIGRRGGKGGACRRGKRGLVLLLLLLGRLLWRIAAAWRPIDVPWIHCECPIPCSTLAINV